MWSDLFSASLSLAKLAFVLLLIAALCAAYAYSIPALFLFAAIPGVIAVTNHLFTASQRFEAHKAGVQRAFQDIRVHYGIFEADLTQIDQHAPSFRFTLAGALCLTAIFVVAAAVSENESRPSAKTPPGASNSAASATPTAAADAVPTPPATISQAKTVLEPSEWPSPAQPNRTPRDSQAARLGFVFAAYGAYVLTLSLMITRLNSSALTPKFLLDCTLRNAIALALGTAAGLTGIFNSVASDNQRLFVYLAIGLSPTWALAALRDRAKKVFAPDEEGCDILPLCLVDGLDDGIADRLAEIGAWDIQHLVTAKPIELTMRSLYPLPRVIDWMDQAMLIAYVRRKIPLFRACGVRGAIDFATLYADAAGLLPNSPESGELRKARADTVLTSLAQKTEMPLETLTMIGRLLFADTAVNIIWDLYNAGEKDQPSPDAPEADDRHPPRAAPGGPPATGAPPNDLHAEAAMSNATQPEAAALEDLTARLPAVVRAATVVAARAMGIEFETQPAAGGRLWVPPDTEFEQSFAAALRRQLAAWNLQWSGRAADLNGAADWDEAAARIQQHLTSRQSDSTGSAGA